MSRVHPKNPRAPRAPLTLDAPRDVSLYRGPLWRIHTIHGAHPSAWNDFRHWGPVGECRWDPHSPPPRIHRDVAVSYAAPGYATAFAEVFQSQREVALTPDLALTGWMPSRGLELLNLVDSDWALRNGASASLPQARRDICREWARSVWEQLGSSVEGLLTPSTLTGDPMVVLFPRSQSAFPGTPSFSRRLDHTDVVTLATRVGARLGWPVR